MLIIIKIYFYQLFALSTGDDSEPTGGAFMTNTPKNFVVGSWTTDAQLDRDGEVNRVYERGKRNYVRVKYEGSRGPEGGAGGFLCLGARQERAPVPLRRRPVVTR
jgi:hypothetical protein